MAEDRIVKCCAWVDARSISLVIMTNCFHVGVVKVMWCFIFWQISVNISKTVQDWHTLQWKTI